MPRRFLAPLATAFLFVCVAAQALPRNEIAGIVEDSTGAVVAGASVSLSIGHFETFAKTDSSGRFHIEIPDNTNRPVADVRSRKFPTGTLTVQATGFISASRAWPGNGGTTTTEIQIVLEPQFGVNSEHVLVTATRIGTQLEDSPSDSILIPRENVASTPALALDDILRKVPGFTLFRRSSSRTANPTTQGASMRGVGASGTSRALVLVDDESLNDPFGGWVYWDRVARESISDVEIVRGGGSASLYGSSAMGGVVQFRTRRPETTSASVTSSWGNENTPQLSLWTGTRMGPWDASFSSDLFRTDGFILVPSSDRGAIDTAANSRHALTSLNVGRNFGKFNRLFAQGSYFDESRHNGTPIQTNGTRIGDFNTGINLDATPIGTVALRMFGLFESYDQKFSSIAQDRNSETLTNHQRVPSQALGGSAQWSRPIGRHQTLVAGFEMREVQGSSNEDLFRAVNGNTVANGRNLNGGQERTARVFAEDLVQLSAKLTATVSLGYDHWSDFAARSLHINADGSRSLTPFDERTSDAVNPRASLLYKVSSRTSLFGSGYRAFRAPTLNELYRNFRQGNTLTQANALLHAERLTGVEGGIRQSVLSDRLNLKATFFWNDITNAIVNVTKSKDPALITRQRLNVSRLLSTGLNLDGEFRLTPYLQFAGGYQYTHSVVANFTAPPGLGSLNPSLTGNWVPQVPHQQFTVQARYSNPKYLTATVQGTLVGQQFDDDLNSLLLKKFFTVDLYLGRNLGKGLEGFVAAENLFNQRYNVALTPVPNVGPPILARIGLRYQFPGR